MRTTRLLCPKCQVMTRHWIIHDNRQGVCVKCILCGEVWDIKGNPVIGRLRDALVIAKGIRKQIVEIDCECARHFLLDVDCMVDIISEAIEEIKGGQK